MPSPFSNSVFHQIVLGKRVIDQGPAVILGGMVGSAFSPVDVLEDLPIVFLDFETTGVDVKRHRITEIGAIKYVKRKEVGRFSQLVDPEELLDQEVIDLTGITNEMLVGKPKAKEVLPDFHAFLRGCICVAHNAEFDASILAYESARLGIRCNYHFLCTVKMARALIVDVENRKLGTLATHYGLTFESRHRSIGDILVTAQVMWRMLDQNSNLRTLRDLALFRQEVPEL